MPSLKFVYNIDIVCQPGGREGREHMAVRYTGRLQKWNAERGFGSIAADDGGAELFVHVTAFARHGPPPAVGDLLSFEVEPDRDGRRRAVRAMRSADLPARALPPRHQKMSRSPKYEGTGLFSKSVTAAVVCGLVWFGYSAYATRAARFESSLPAPRLSGRLPVPADFRCDGRSICSQMTSCREATLFLQNCAGTQMDGNGDGVPCEQQWCTK